MRHGTAPIGPDGVEELGAADRFHQEARHVGGVSASGRVSASRRGQDDDRWRVFELPGEVVGQLQAIAVRHEVVGEDHVERRPGGLGVARQGQRVGGVRRLGCLQPPRRHVGSEHGQVGGGVVDEQCPGAAQPLGPAHDRRPSSRGEAGGERERRPDAGGAVDGDGAAHQRDETT